MRVCRVYPESWPAAKDRGGDGRGLSIMRPPGLYYARMTWVTDSIFVAGGDFVREFWSDFQSQAGVSAVITVSAEGPLAYRDPLPWAALWLPVDDEPDYTLDQLALGVSFIEAALAAGRKVLLHGPKGVHRTRPLVAGHLIASGKSLARAIREMEDKPWLPPYKGSTEVLEALAGARGLGDRGKGSKAYKGEGGARRLVEVDESDVLGNESDEGMALS